MEHNQKPYVIDIEGNQVFSADFVFEQMQAQGCRIDRARSLAVGAVVVALAAMALAVVVLFLR